MRPQETRDFLANTLKSEICINALQEPSSFFARVNQALIDTPPLITTHQGKKNKTTQSVFTSWFNVLRMRPNYYINSYLHDLYYLHELIHITTLTYDSAADYQSWVRKMIRNEVTASFITEALIYFNMPRLRDNTFPYIEIWVDRFLRNEILLSSNYSSNQEYYTADPKEFTRSLFFYYLRSYYRKPNTIRHETEDFLVKGRHANEAWCEIWRSSYSAVESMVKQLKTGALSAEKYTKWLESLTSTCDDKLLFAPQARAFSCLPGIRLDLPKKLHHGLRYKLACAASELATNVQQDKVTITPQVKPAIKLLYNGISQTIYSYFSPEIENACKKAANKLLDHKLHNNAYERVQDVIHEETLRDYVNFVYPIVRGLDTYAHRYPSNGSSEGLQTTIAYFKSEYPQAKLHVFRGEYEGAIHYGNSMKYELVKHDREQRDFDEIFKRCQPNDLFYISQPSGLDGNCWERFPDFIKAAEKVKVKVIVDLAYVGTVAKQYSVDVSSEAIIAVVSSLSKMGPYYKRMGYAFTRFVHPLLTGNKWFKNIDSLVTASTLMNSSGITVTSLAEKYHQHQQILINWIKSETNGLITLTPSDVFMVATIPDKDKYHLLPEEFRGLIRENGVLRVCLVTGIKAIEELAKENNLTIDQLAEYFNVTDNSRQLSLSLN
jgi:hypothetical protein